MKGDRMTITEALKYPDSSQLQPEGKEVEKAYREGKLDHTTCLYVIAFLLHTINTNETSDVFLDQ